MVGTRHPSVVKTHLSHHPAYAGHADRKVLESLQKSGRNRSELCVFPRFPNQFTENRDHIKELGNQRPSKPFFFLKPPSTILPPPETAQKDGPYKLTGPVLLPNGINCHYEVELALIVGKTLSNFRHIRKQSPENADKYWMDKIEGYAIGKPIGLPGLIVGIDLTARNLQEQVKKAGLPWTAAKGVPPIALRD